MPAVSPIVTGRCTDKYFKALDGQTITTVSYDMEARTQELCESRGGRPGSRP